MSHDHNFNKMSESKIVTIDDTIEVDAELMSAWLNNMGDIEMSPKLLFDLQTLLRYYGDMLAPNSNVNISYPVEGGCPSASKDNNKVMIPLEMLEQGRVDDTIASVIHEIHHILYSPNEKDIVINLFGKFKAILQSLSTEHLGRKLSVWDVIQMDSVVTASHIISGKSNNIYFPFVQEAFQAFFFLMNVFEDVRIDEKQPKNLKKYRYKMEQGCLKIYLEKLQEDGADKSLMGKLFSALYHYKDLHKSNQFEDCEVSRNFILKCEEGLDYQDAVTKLFASDLQEFCGALWEKNQEQSDSSGESSIDEFLHDLRAGENEDNSLGAKEDSDLEISTLDCSKVDMDILGQDSSVSEFAKKELEVEFSAKVSKSSDEKDANHKYSSEKTLSQDAWAEIQAFKQIKHIKCSEVVECSKGFPVEYDTVIFDTYA